MTELSNSLADLAEQIKEAHGQFTTAKRMTAEKAIETGRLLSQAKEQCQHGEWLPFLARSGIGDRWARRLMQIARSGLKTDTVADLGIKGTLDYLAARRLPAKGQCLIVGRADVGEVDTASPIAIITPSEVSSGYFDITVYDASSGHGEELVRPVLGNSIEFTDGTSYVAVWQALDEMLPMPASERAFKLMWASDLEDDCAFLNDASLQPGIGSGMPASYLAAVTALRICEAHFTREAFLDASAALSTVLRRMNMWPDDPRMFRVFSTIANDETLSRLAKIVGQKALQDVGRAPA